MPSVHFSRPILKPAVLLAVTGLALSACGGSGTPSANPSTSSSAPAASSSAPSTAPSSSGEPTSGPGAVAAIKANWAEFFNAKTSISRRLQLLQNGQVFAAVIRSQASSPLALSASSKVTNVSLTGTDQASVTYEILVSGTPALTGQKGVAVYQGGIWKVGIASFCALLTLQNGGKTSGLPSGCKQ